MHFGIDPRLDWIWFSFTLLMNRNVGYLQTSFQFGDACLFLYHLVRFLLRLFLFLCYCCQFCSWEITTLRQILDLFSFFWSMHAAFLRLAVPYFKQGLGALYFYYYKRNRSVGASSLSIDL